MRPTMVIAAVTSTTPMEKKSRRTEAVNVCVCMFASEFIYNYLRIVILDSSNLSWKTNP